MSEIVWEHATPILVSEIEDEQALEMARQRLREMAEVDGFDHEGMEFSVLQPVDVQDPESESTLMIGTVKE